MTKYAKSGSKAAPRKMADGGLLDRLTAGNIDEPGSRAYNTWGAGAKDESSAETARLSRPVETSSAAPAASAGESPDPESSSVSATDSPDYGNEGRRTKQDSASPKPKASKPKAKAAAPAKMASQSFGSGLASGLSRGKDAADGASKSDRAERLDKSFYKTASASDPNNGIGAKVGGFFKSLGSGAARAYASEGYVNGGLIGKGAVNAGTAGSMGNQSSGAGGAKSYGKK